MSSKMAEFVNKRQYGKQFNNLGLVNPAFTSSVDEVENGFGQVHHPLNQPNIIEENPLDNFCLENTGFEKDDASIQENGINSISDDIDTEEKQDRKTTFLSTDKFDNSDAAYPGTSSILEDREVSKVENVFVSSTTPDNLDDSISKGRITLREEDKDIVKNIPDPINILSRESNGPIATNIPDNFAANISEGEEISREEFTGIIDNTPINLDVMGDTQLHDQKIPEADATSISSSDESNPEFYFDLTNYNDHGEKSSSRTSPTLNAGNDNDPQDVIIQLDENGSPVTQGSDEAQQFYKIDDEREWLQSIVDPHQKFFVCFYFAFLPFFHCINHLVGILVLVAH